MKTLAYHTEMWDNRSVQSEGAVHLLEAWLPKKE